jgi:Tol biopolymer transport system component/DNA-binding winged helix-turn-helix (wHTH) protein
MDDASSNSSGPPALRFGVFELSVKTGELRKAGVLINLPPQPAKILALLASHQGELISREDIQQQVWGENTFVDFDRGLNFAIMKIRAALGDDADTPRYVETLPRRGYRFIAPVDKSEVHAPHDGAAEAAEALAPPVFLRQQTIPELTTETAPPPALIVDLVKDHGHAPKWNGGGRPETVGALQRTSIRLWRPWLMALALAGILGAVAMWSYAKKAPSVSRSVSRFTLSLPETDTFENDGGLAVSPNGRTLVYVAWHNGTRQLFRRALDQIEAVPIADTESASFPFFSPDGQWIGFFADDALLKKVPLQGGPTMTICPAGYRKGASWGPNGVIVFATNRSPDLMQVADTGGTPKPLTAMATQKGQRAAWPELTADGRAVLYTVVSGSLDEAHIIVRSIDTGAERDLVPGTCPRLTPTGHLVFARSGALWAVPFDHQRLVVTDLPAKVLEGVEVFGEGGLALFSVSRDGSLLHATPGRAIVVARDRTGRSDVLLGVPHGYYKVPQPSPDGHRLAMAFSDRAGDKPAISIYDLDRRLMRRLTSERSLETDPLWTPDGQRIVFSSDRVGGLHLFWTAADGSGVAEPLTSGLNGQRPASWTPDGRVLAFVGSNGGPLSDIWTLGVNSAQNPEPFVHTPDFVWASGFSPDARWLAYDSSESGQREVYVRPFPAAGGQWQVSSQGGAFPQWSPSRMELFYLDLEYQMMAVEVTSEPTFQAAAPRVLFASTGRPGRGAGQGGYSVMPDGEHFVMLQQVDAPRQLHVTLNWLDDLKAHVRTK